MKNATDLTDKHGNIRELERKDFAHMHPAKEVLPDLLTAWEKERTKRIKKPLNLPTQGLALHKEEKLIITTPNE